jgi:hypothetical protein
MKQIACSLDRDESFVKDMMGLDYDLMMIENAQSRFEQREDPDWIETVWAWRKVKEDMKLLEDSEKELRDQLIKMANNRNAAGGGVKVERVVRKGNVDFHSIDAIKNMDLEPYRKQATAYWKIYSDDVT